MKHQKKKKIESILLSDDFKTWGKKEKYLDIKTVEADTSALCL